jgi:hypothetical protein
MHSSSCRMLIDYIIPVYRAVQEALGSSSKTICILSHREKFNRTINISKFVCDIQPDDIWKDSTADSITLMVNPQKHSVSTSDLQHRGLCPPLIRQVKKEIALVFSGKNVAKTRPIGYENVCVVCRKSYKVKTCQKCRSVYYCGRIHQKQHWKTHKLNCRSA